MRICILASNENVEAVRQTARDNGINHEYLLAIPVSPNGEEPATHWFCNFKISQEMYSKLMSIKNLSEMEVRENWKKFLKDKGLELIREK